MSKATPRPWIWDEPSNWLGLSTRVCTEKYEPIAQVQLSGWPRRVGLANVELIVNAVNNHDTLRQALAEAGTILEALNVGTTWELAPEVKQQITNVLPKIRHALFPSKPKS